MNTIFEKGKIPSDFRELWLNPFIRKMIKLSVLIIDALVWFLGIKLLSMMVLLRLRDAVDKVLIKKSSVVLGRESDALIKFSLLD